MSKRRLTNKGVMWLTIGLVALVALAFPAVAGFKDKAKTITVTGQIACARCTLQLEDAEECQSVLVVEESAGAKAEHYYLVDNKVAEEYGHVCMGYKPAVVTGKVKKKDGKMWLTPTKMEPPEEA